MGKRLIGSVGLKPGTDTGFDLDTKGQIHGYSDTQFALPVGDDNQVLTSLASEASGLKWAAAGGVSNPVLANLVFNDDVEAQFGTGGSDSAIYHDGTNFYQKVTTGMGIFNGNFTMAAGKCMTNNSADVTISSGTVTGTSNNLRVDTEGAASSDSLDSADYQAAGVTGAYFSLFSQNDSRDVTVEDQAVSPYFLMEGDFTLDTTQDCIFFNALNGRTHNHEISRSNNS